MMSRTGLGLRAWLAFILGTLAAVATSPAYGATTYPQSNGSAGACNLTGTINTDTGSGVPLGGYTFEAATGTTPQLMAVHCTTITIANGVTVQVTGSRALDLRAQGAVQIDGFLRLFAFDAGQLPGPGGGMGGARGGIPNPSGGGNGAGQGPGGGGSVGGAGGGTGGLPGMAYNGGAPGETGESTGTADFGGGGGGAGGGGGFSVGSGGGGGGSSSTGDSDGGFGGGGGGAVRILSDTSITIGTTGIAISTKGATPGAPLSPTNPSGGAGGGGSGGSQVLIAPAVSIQPSVALDARGGDGDLPSVPPGAARGGDGANGVISIITDALTNTSMSITPAPVESRYSDLVTAAVTGAGTGTVTSSPPGINCGPDCSEIFDPGATVTLTATATPPSIFSSWLGDCASQAGPQCVLTTGEVRSASASFANPPVTAPPPAPAPAKKKKCKKKKRGRGAVTAKKCKRKKKRR